MRFIVLAALMLAAAAEQANCASYDDLNAGIQLHNTRQWSNSILLFDKALAANDLVPSLQFVAHLDRGEAHINLAHHELAISDYSSALELKPGDAQALSRRAFVYLNIGKFEQAAADLDSLITAKPLWGRAYTWRAAISAKRGQFDKSRQDLQTALSLLPKQTRRGMGIGIMAWELGQAADAEDNFSYATTDGSGNIYAWLWLSLSQARQGKDASRRSLPEFDRKKWPAPIVSLYLGEADQDAVFAAASTGSPEAIQGQVCEANFYLGEWRLQHNDRAGAKPLIDKAARDCPTGFVEWSPAQMELANLP